MLAMEGEHCTITAPSPHHHSLPFPFVAGDLDKDGQLHLVQLQRLFHAMKLPVEEAELIEILAWGDTDHSGNVREGGFNFKHETTPCYCCCCNEYIYVYILSV